MWRMLVGFLPLSLPPAGRCLPKQTCFVSQLRFVFFLLLSSSLPVGFPFDRALWKSQAGRDKQTLGSAARPRHLPQSPGNGCRGSAWGLTSQEHLP